MSKPPPGPWMLGQVMGIYSEVHWCSGWQNVTVLDFQHGKNVGIPLVLPTIIVHEFVMLQEIVILDFLPPSVR